MGYSKIFDVGLITGIFARVYKGHIVPHEKVKQISATINEIDEDLTENSCS